jgi:3D (Asp-Asp-Asp) domain-containing protein
MSHLFSLALTGFFVWSGVASSTVPAFSAKTDIAISAVPAKVLTVEMTAYNAVPEQTDADPFTTASGAFSNPQVVAARSRDLAGALPFGTVIALETAEKSHSCGFSAVEHLIGYRVVADTMHERMRERIDILFDENDTVEIGVNGEPKKTMNPARAFGLCTVTARVVGKIDIKDIPATQAELALVVNRSLAAK